MSVGAVNKQTGDRIPTAGMPAIDDALDLTSVNPVQNAIVAAALALKQNATDNNLETTSKTVVGAVNELKSGLTDYEATTNAALALPENTGKNVLPTILESIKTLNSSGSWDGNTYTIYGVSFQVVTNGDKVTGIVVNRVSANENVAIFTVGVYKAKSGDILSGCPSGGSEQTYKLYSRGGSTNDTGNGTTIAAGDVGVSRSYSIAVFATGSPTGLTFYPMIRPATITDPTFAPYIPSVESRLAGLNSVLLDIFAPTNRLTASDDLNAVITPGAYYTRGSDNPAHNPGANSFIYVIKQCRFDDVVRYMQIVYSFNSDKLYIRRTIDGGENWTDWVSINTTVVN